MLALVRVAIPLYLCDSPWKYDGEGQADNKKRDGNVKVEDGRCGDRRDTEYRLQ